MCFEVTSVLCKWLIGSLLWGRANHSIWKVRKHFHSTVHGKVGGLHSPNVQSLQFSGLLRVIIPGTQSLQASLDDDHDDDDDLNNVCSLK